jgi:hypothetical protein
MNPGAEIKLKENEKKYLTCMPIYGAVNHIRNKSKNLGTVIRFIKNKNIMKKRK